MSRNGEFAAATAAVQAMVARFAQREDVGRALDRLKESLTAADPPAQSKIRRDTDGLTRRAGREPLGDQGAALLLALRWQRQIVLAYDGLADEYGKRPQDERPPDLAPSRVYANARGDGELDAKTAWTVLYELDGALDTLLEPDGATPRPARALVAGEEATEIGDTIASLAFVSRRTADRQTVRMAAAAEERPLVDRQTSQQIVAGIQHWDWTLGILTGALTILVYVVGIYGDTWGGWEDWVTAFSAGIVGQAAAGLTAAFSKLPVLQSYRIDPK